MRTWAQVSCMIGMAEKTGEAACSIAVQACKVLQCRTQTAQELRWM